MKKKFGTAMLATTIALGGVGTTAILSPLAASASEVENVWHNDANFYEYGTWTFNGGAFNEGLNVKKGDVITHSVSLDDYENPVANTQVRMVLKSGTTVNYSPIATTDADGKAQLSYTLPTMDQGKTYSIMVQSNKNGTWTDVTDIPLQGFRGTDIDYTGDGKLYAESVRSINVAYSSPDENKLRANMTVTTSDDPDITDFQPRYTIQDVNGVIVKTGLLSNHTYTDTTSTYGKGNSITDIDVSDLSAGDYRIKVYQPVTGGELKSIPVNSAFPTMECHFHIKLDRAVNDFIPGPLQN